MGKLARGKGEGSTPKALFLSYFAEGPLIQFSQLVPFKAWSKLEGFSWVLVGKTSRWNILDSKVGVVLVKEGTVFLKGKECRLMPLV